MADNHITPRLFSVEQTAEYFGLSPQTIYNQVSRKSKKKFPIKPIRIGRLVKFDRFEIDKFIEKN